MPASSTDFSPASIATQVCICASPPHLLYENPTIDAAGHRHPRGPMTETSGRSRSPSPCSRAISGSGKTTLLNRILSENHGRKICGHRQRIRRDRLDNDLIVESDEEIYEMNNGCVCCTVRGDLIRVVEGLMRRPGRFDAIIVEDHRPWPTRLPSRRPSSWMTTFRAKTETGRGRGARRRQAPAAASEGQPRGRGPDRLRRRVLLNKTDLGRRRNSSASRRPCASSIRPPASIARKRSEIDLGKCSTRVPSIWTGRSKTIPTSSIRTDHDHVCGPDLRPRSPPS
ncbi:hypothetical protein F2981_03550 [Sinorhizobium meliloti]|nr:hypothetical protein [Sinorhizobium meliloti]